ncbi:hypothetical protein JT358_16090 [Micrococcales bacterium 31B]|nr:hypothetical protein [Micrococcales bacterium 31B]
MSHSALNAFSLVIPLAAGPDGEGFGEVVGRQIGLTLIVYIMLVIAGFTVFLVRRRRQATREEARQPAQPPRASGPN